MQPQQPYQSPMQPAPAPKKNLMQTILFALLVMAGVTLLISAAAWIYLSTKQSSDTGKAVEGAAQVLEPTDAAPVTATIASDLGMQVSYNARELAGFGFAENVTYSSNDLAENRAYSVMRIRPVETSQATRSEISPGSPELRITSSLDKEYWQQLEGKEEYKDLSKIDQVVKQTSDQRKTDRHISASDASVVRAGEVEYRKVSYTNKNESLGVTTIQREDCYMTVQNDRPYVACINNIRSSNFAVVPQLENVLATLRYSAPKAEALIAEKSQATQADAAMLSDAADEDVSGRSEAVDASSDKGDEAQSQKKIVDKERPSYLTSSQDLRTFLKAAPATVRVGMIYCADINLSLPTGGAGAQLTGACVDRGASGFFISHDGLLSTSASVVQVRPQDAVRSYIIDAPSTDQMYSRLDRVLGYLVEARNIMQSDADAIRDGVQERNQDAIDKVSALAGLISPENITISQEKYKYALQLSNKPIVVSTLGNGQLDFAYSDQVIEAELVAQKLSTDKTREQIQKGEFLADDTALLKAKKQGTYPALPFASTSNVGSGTNVNIIGMPLYAVGSLEAAQLRATPMLRQGKADEVFNGAGSQRHLSIKTSSHAGLIGAPALNESAQVIAVASYGNLNCPTGKCFGGTILRDVVDIRNLLRDRNITLSPSSPINETWNMAVNEMIKGDYRGAYELFNKSTKLYPANYLATPYANFVKDKVGSPSDTSGFNSWMKVAQMVAIGSVITLVLLGIARLAMKLFTRPQPQTQYGQLSGGQYIDPAQWQRQGAVQPSGIPQQQSWNSQGAPAYPPQNAQQPSAQSGVQSQPGAMQPPATQQPPQYSQYPPETPPTNTQPPQRPPY